MERDEVKEKLIIIMEKTLSSTISQVLKKYHIEIYKRVIELTNYLEEDVRLTERIYNIINDITGPMICKCGGKLNFIDYTHGYRKYCGRKCIVNIEETNIKAELTNKEKYGSNNVFGNKEIQEKIKKTTLEKYGVTNVSYNEETIEKRNKTRGEIKKDKSKKLPKILNGMMNVKFNRLILIEYIGRDKHEHPMGRFQCECGNMVECRLAAVKSNHTQSCGCFNVERTKETHTKHGMHDTRTYDIYQHMLQRCYNLKDKSYKYYGGRGIKVCDEWLNSFEKFYEDMGECPNDFSIERIDVNGNYCKENCIWASDLDQARNKTNTKLNLEKANEIRELFSTGKYKYSDIAKLYDVDTSIIRYVILNKTWKTDEE